MNKVSRKKATNSVNTLLSTMANLYMRYFLWLSVLSTSVILSASKICTGDPDINTQLRTALSYTKTKEFEELFNLIRSSAEWEEYSNYIKNTFGIDVENIIQNADPNDTIRSFKRKAIRHIPFDIKVRLVVARWSLDLKRGIVLYEGLSTLPEVQTIIYTLCSMNVNIEEIASALMQ